MLTDKKITFKILSVLKLSWESSTKQASPRPYHALSIRTEGGADFINGENRASVSRGGIAYVPKGCGYTIDAHSKETVIVVHFDILDAELNEIEAFQPMTPDIMIDIFYKMYRAWRAKEIGYEYRVESLFSRVLEGLVTQSFATKHNIKPAFSTLLGFIHTNFTDPSLTVDSMARRINVSTTYLRRLFHENIGTSPVKYLTRLRLDYAKQLLESGYYTVEQVSRLSGYSDPKYFSTLYKKTNGKPPRG